MASVAVRGIAPILRVATRFRDFAVGFRPQTLPPEPNGDREVPSTKPNPYCFPRPAKAPQRTVPLLRERTEPGKQTSTVSVAAGRR